MNWCNAGNVIPSYTLAWWKTNGQMFYICIFSYGQGCYGSQINQTLVDGAQNCGLGQGAWERYGPFGNAGYGYDPVGIAECGGIPTY